jgi:hypothetical protein
MASHACFTPAQTREFKNDYLKVAGLFQLAPVGKSLMDFL